MGEGAVLLDAMRLTESATPNQAAGFLIRLGEHRDFGAVANDDLRRDFIRALESVSEEPRSLIVRVQTGEFYSNGTTQADYGDVSFARVLPGLVDQLGFSVTDLTRVRDLALAGASHESLARGVEHEGFTGKYEASQTARDLALLAVRAATLLARHTAEQSHRSVEDLGCFSSGTEAS